VWLFDVAKQKGQAPINLVNEIHAASNVLAQQPEELDGLISSVQRDVARLDAVQVNVPDFGDPLSGVHALNLKSADPIVRADALDGVSARARALRDDYVRKLNDLKERRAAAQKVADEAQTINRKGYDVEKALDAVNSSAAGPLLNMGGGKLTQMLFEHAVYLRPALADRARAARNLVSRCDSGIETMEKTLERESQFYEWASFYRWQDWARQNFASNRTADQVIKPSENLSEAGKILNGAVESEKAIARNQAPSKGETLMKQLVAETVASTNASKVEAEKLLREAEEMDRQAAQSAVLQEFAALTTLAATFAGPKPDLAPSVDSPKDGNVQRQSQPHPPIPSSPPVQGPVPIRPPPPIHVRKIPVLTSGRLK
jgi:hypothetical protein